MENYKTCIRCKQNKNTNLFARNKLTADGLQTYCKSCQKDFRKPEENKKYLAIYQKEKRNILLPKKRINSKLYYQKNRESVLEKQRLSYRPEESQKKSSIRRARMKHNPIYKVTTVEILRLRLMPCFYCAKPGGSIDHVIPVSRGGSHSLGNLVSCCQSCNASKGARFLTEWKKVRGW